MAQGGGVGGEEGVDLGEVVGGCGGVDCEGCGDHYEVSEGEGVGRW